MSATVLIGSQWGDEGKGKIIDVLTRQVDWVVRYQGGNNAGHTVEVGDEQYILHLIPSGILREGKHCVIGHGMVVDPLELMKEMKGLEERGVEMDKRLAISDRAHVVMPYHRLLDAGNEKRLADGEKIGTTKRGIGPTYSDKVTRSGLRFCDFFALDLKEVFRMHLERSNECLQAIDSEVLDVEATVSELMAAAEYLKPYIKDTIVSLNDALDRDEGILFEGAQGTMLDIDYGSYPFVTSSSASAGGAATGSGIAPHRIDGVLGVVKAYTTRVGQGPMPTELEDEMGEHLRNEGGEYGATTGRPRRCGWFDAVVARYSARLNGIDHWALTKLDVLDKVETIRICTGYEIDGQILDSVPASAHVLEGCVPIYEEMEGWQTSIKDVESFDELPDRAKAYIARLEELTGVKTAILSVGPRRDSTIVLENCLFG